LIARVTPFDLIGLKRSPDSEPTGTRPYRVGPTICFLPSFSSTRQPQETVILGLRRTCEFPQTTAIWFSDSAAIRAALRLQMPRRRGEGGGMDPVSVPASAESTAGEEGRRYCSAGGARWLPFVRGQPHRPPPPFRFAAVAFSLADRRGTHYNVAACAERPALRVSC